MSAFSIGLSALGVSQRLLDLTGQNIANAGTPGYHRQLALLAARTAGQPIGTGVEITRFRQARSSFLEEALLRSRTGLEDVTARLTFLRRIESALAPGEGSAHDLLERLFNQIDQLAADPGNVAQRRVVLGTASALTERLGSLNGELRRMSQDLDGEARLLVDEVNQLTPQVAELNRAIQEATLRGIEANDLRDQRDGLVSRLAELIDVRTIEQDFGQTTVLAAGLPVVLGITSVRLQHSTDLQDRLVLAAEGAAIPLNVAGGRAAGLLELRNAVLPSFRARIDSLARELVRGLDGVQATGLGLSGPFTLLSGERAVSGVNVPLAQAGLSFPPQAGVLTVGVTDLSTGSRTLTQVAIDPAAQSLQGLAAALSAVPNIQAVADPQTNTLKLLAAPGHGFDFAGGTSSAPATVAITGTTVPRLGGTYTGADNDTYTFRVAGSGTIGVTPGLALEVRNGANALVARLNVGQGYEPGSMLPPVNGVSVSLSAGTANDGDSFTVPVVAEADTAGLLTALGLNTLFTGEDADSFAVRAELLVRPEGLAAGRTGLPGDASNLRRMAALRDEKRFAGGTQNFREFHAALVGEVGVGVQDLGLRRTAQEALGQRLEAERQSVSGVDPNEELVRLLQFQRFFQASARYLATVNETLAELFNII